MGETLKNPSQIRIRRTFLSNHLIDFRMYVVYRIHQEGFEHKMDAELREKQEIIGKDMFEKTGGEK